MVRLTALQRNGLVTKILNKLTEEFVKQPTRGQIQQEAKRLSKNWEKFLQSEDGKVLQKYKEVITMPVIAVVKPGVTKYGTYILYNTGVVGGVNSNIKVDGTPYEVRFRRHPEFNIISRAHIDQTLAAEALLTKDPEELYDRVLDIYDALLTEGP